MFTDETRGMVYNAADGLHSTSWERSLSYVSTIYPCSTDTLGRYPSTLPRAHLAQRLVSPLWRHDHHDGFYRRSTREEFSFTRDVCELSREGGTSAGGSTCK